MRSWKRYAAALALNVSLTLLVLWRRGFGLKIYYVDAFSVAGAVSLFLGGLWWVASAGVFDMAGYGFSTLRSRRRDRDFYEYTLRKREQRGRRGRPFLPCMAVGLAFLLISFLISTW